MKKTKLISENANYAAVNVGKLSELNDSSLIHPAAQ